MASLRPQVCVWVCGQGKCQIVFTPAQFIYLWSVGGDLLHRWSGIRVHDLAIGPTGDWMIVITERKMLRYSLTGEMALMHTHTESDPITSMYLSQTGLEGLVNLSTQEIHLWDLSDGGGRVVRTFSGFKQVASLWANWAGSICHSKLFWRYE